jgi:exosortase
MASSGLTPPSGELTPERHGSGGVSWLPILFFGALLLLLFAPVIVGMAKEWSSDDDMGHGFFVPVVAGWVVWQKREELSKLPVKSNNWGFLFLLWGGFQLFAGTLGVELFVARTALLASLVGVILAVWGVAALRVLAFPLFLLAFMIRIPAIIFNQITFPLQLFASSVAEIALSLVGIPVFREGNILELPSQRLSVVEACSGIRSLLSLTFLSLVYGYLFETKTWLRVVLFFATVPIAIAANAFRVTMTGILSEYKRELAEGFFHAAEGWVIFMIALMILVLVHQALDKVYKLAYGER